MPGDGLKDPQLPAYALSVEPTPGAVAFARLRAPEQVFDGLSDNPAGTPGIIEIGNARRSYAAIDSWDDLLNGWRTEIGQLASAYAAGHAPVAPRDKRTCEYCHLHALCRISDRAPFNNLDEAATDD